MLAPQFGQAKARATQAMTSIKTAIHAMADHLSDADITGAMRDTAKDPVRKPGSGEEYDHLDEVQSSLRALKNTPDTLTQIRAERERILTALLAALKQDPEWPVQRRSYEEILRLIAPDRQPPDGGEFDRDRDVDWALLAPLLKN